MSGICSSIAIATVFSGRAASAQPLQSRVATTHCVPLLRCTREISSANACWGWVHRYSDWAPEIFLLCSITIAWAVTRSRSSSVISTGRYGVPLVGNRRCPLLEIRELHIKRVTRRIQFSYTEVANVRQDDQIAVTRVCRPHPSLSTREWGGSQNLLHTARCPGACQPF